MKKIDWFAVVFFVVVHFLGFLGLKYLIFDAPNSMRWFAVIMYHVYFPATTMGYHRYYSHRSFSCAKSIQWYFALIGAGNFGREILWWATNHRFHHFYVDTDKDPHNATNKKFPFWWPHILWIVEDHPGPNLANPDFEYLVNNPIVQFQRRRYRTLAVLSGIILPGLIGIWLCNIGTNQIHFADLANGFWAGVMVSAARLIVQIHFTFSVNSVAHMFGVQNHNLEDSSRDCWWISYPTMGEGGHHNKHHAFPSDYRNGVYWYDFDPTKWLIWLLSTANLTWDLKRTPQHIIDAAYKRTAAEKKLQKALKRLTQ